MVLKCILFKMKKKEKKELSQIIWNSDTTSQYINII